LAPRPIEGGPIGHLSNTINYSPLFKLIVFEVLPIGPPLDPDPYLINIGPPLDPDPYLISIGPPLDPDPYLIRTPPGSSHLR
jgi:hypothetical protein